MKPDVTVVFVLRDDVVFVSAVSAEACWVKPVARSIGILELTLEQNGAWLVRKRGEDLARAGNEPVQFECEERSVPGPTALTFGEAYQRQEAFELLPTMLCVDSSVFG